MALHVVLRSGKIAYDRRTDAMYALLPNDRALVPRQVLAAHKRPMIERRFDRLTRTEIEAPPTYPEDRRCRRPTAERLLRLFPRLDRRVVAQDGRDVCSGGRELSAEDA